MGMKILIVAFILVLTMSFVSAEILLSQPNSIYNLGDDLNVEVEIKPSQYTSTFFELLLGCGSQNINIHKEHLTLDAGEKKQITSSLSLARSFLGNMSGECQIVALFGSDIADTQKFIISNNIQVTLTLENMSVDAGKEITLKGTAVKENGEKVNGFLDVNVEGTGIRVTREVVDGLFETNLMFPTNSRAGTYILNARVYEKSQGAETNSGSTSVSLGIKKIPSNLEIALSKQNILPSETLTYSPIIYDQSKERISGEVSVKIYDPFDEVLSQEIVKSGEEKKLELELQAAPGYWRIEGQALGLETKRLFYVDELEKASFSLENDTLIIKNIGNVVYKKPVQISIGGVTDIKNINLDVGQDKKLRLLAPKGSYNIRVTDGSDELVTEGVSLTGRVVGVSEVKGGLNFISKYPVVWLFLAAVFGLFIIMLVQRVAKKNFIARAPYNVKKQTQQEKEVKKQKIRERTEISAPRPSLPERAEHSLVLHGKKENSGIVVVKLRDIDKLGKKSSIIIDSVIKNIVENNGAVYEYGDYIIGIFSPLMTKTFDNELLAIKTSKQINEILNQHNKVGEKIDFGVGLNSGDLIVEKDVHKLKFTNIGNTLNIGKRVADLARDEVLLSENMHNKLRSQVRADKEVKQGINVYHIKSVVDRDRNKAFIADFLNRQQQDVKKK